MGGVEFSTLYLAERLDRQRFCPIVICPTEGDLPNLLRARAIEVVIVPQPHLFASSIGLGGRYWPNPFAWVVNAFLFLVIASRVARCLRQHEIDLVCTKGLYAHFYGGLAARWANRPCVWHVQDLVSNRAGGVYALFLGVAGRLLAHRVVGDGWPILDQLSPYIPNDQLQLIHNGVDVQAFSPNIKGRAVRAEWGVSDADVLIGNVARFTRWKGQHYLIEAFAAIGLTTPPSKLVLVGAPVFDTTDYEMHLRSLVKEHGLEDRVIFTGYRLDLPDVLGALDIFVHTSVEKDTSPLAVVSAMATGKAIVSTNVSGVAELFPKGDEAILVPVADETALHEALGLLIRQPERRLALGQAARRQAESTLSLEYFVAQWQQILERMLPVQ